MEGIRLERGGSNIEDSWGQGAKRRGRKTAGRGQKAASYRPLTTGLRTTRKQRAKRIALSAKR